MYNLLNIKINRAMAVEPLFKSSKGHSTYIYSSIEETEFVLVYNRNNVCFKKL